MSDAAAPWLPAGFSPPGWAQLSRELHLRPSPVSDVDLDPGDQAPQQQSYDYALLDRDETAPLGGVSVRARADQGAEVTWWVVDALAGTSAEADLGALVPAWIAACWPFREVSFADRDVSRYASRLTATDLQPARFDRPGPPSAG